MRLRSTLIFASIVLILGTSTPCARASQQESARQCIAALDGGSGRTALLRSTETSGINPLLVWAMEMSRKQKEEREKNGGEEETRPAPESDTASEEIAIDRD